MIEAMGRGWADRDASIFLTLQEERAQVQVRLPPHSHCGGLDLYPHETR